MKSRVREEMTKEFINSLKENVIPWEQEWVGGERAFNPTTGTRYRGTNAFWLAWNAHLNQWKDPRWCTFAQAQKNGWKIKSGSKGTRIEFFSPYDKQEKRKITYKELAKLQKTLTLEELEVRISYPVANYVVFNAVQIEGIPNYIAKIPEWNKENVIVVRDNLFKNMGLNFNEGGERAYYNQSIDSITLPEIDKFISEYGYLATMLHEAGHATGHKSRLNRDMSGHFGSKKYAREELRAEIASAFTALEIGISNVEIEHTNNHKAYIQNWIEFLEKNPNELFLAIRDAEQISKYLIDKGEFSLERVQEKEDVKNVNKDFHIDKGEKSERKGKGKIRQAREKTFEQRMYNYNQLEKKILESQNQKFEKLMETRDKVKGDYGIQDFHEKLDKINENVAECKDTVEKISQISEELTYQELFTDKGSNFTHEDKKNVLSSDKTIVAIESTDDYIDYEWGFNPVDGKPKYRLVQIKEDDGVLVGYPDGMFLDFNSMDDLNRYVQREADKIDIISYDEIITKSLTRKREIRLNEQMLEQIDNDISGTFLSKPVFEIVLPEKKHPEEKCQEEQKRQEQAKEQNQSGKEKTESEEKSVPLAPKR